MACWLEGERFTRVADAFWECFCRSRGPLEWFSRKKGVLGWGGGAYGRWRAVGWRAMDGRCGETMGVCVARNR